MSFRERVAENIDDMIMRSGKTKTWIAKELNINLVTVIDYTKGRSIPSLEIFYELCQLLGCSYSEILD